MSEHDDLQMYLDEHILDTWTIRVLDCTANSRLTVWKSLREHELPHVVLVHPGRTPNEAHTSSVEPRERDDGYSNHNNHGSNPKYTGVGGNSSNLKIKPPSGYQIYSCDLSSLPLLAIWCTNDIARAISVGNLQFKFEKPPTFIGKNDMDETIYVTAQRIRIHDIRPDPRQRVTLTTTARHGPCPAFGWPCIKGNKVYYVCHRFIGHNSVLTRVITRGAVRHILSDNLPIYAHSPKNHSLSKKNRFLYRFSQRGKYRVTPCDMQVLSTLYQAGTIDQTYPGFRRLFIRFKPLLQNNLISRVGDGHQYAITNGGRYVLYSLGGVKWTSSVVEATERSRPTTTL